MKNLKDKSKTDKPKKEKKVFAKTDMTNLADLLMDETDSDFSSNGMAPPDWIMCCCKHEIPHDETMKFKLL